MLAASENYKGIKYVRVSSLPLEQKNRIWNSINQNTIIKILKDDTLLNDCIQYKHYEAWYEENYPKSVENLKTVEVPTDLAIAS